MRNTNDHLIYIPDLGASLADTKAAVLSHASRRWIDDTARAEGLDLRKLHAWQVLAVAVGAIRSEEPIEP